MALSFPPLTTLSDAELLETLHRLASRERHATAALVASLGEVDARRLYLGEGCSSLFTYCTRVLHLSEHAAYNRIEAARVARRFPIVLERLADGSVTLTAVRLLAPHLTTENHVALLDAARHQSKHEVERLVAALRPKPDVPATVRKLRAPGATDTTLPSVAPEPDRGMPNERPAPAPALVPAVALSVTPKRPSVQPLAPSRYKVQLTLDDEGVALLRRAQALMRHRRPDGDMGAIVTEGLRLLVEQLEKARAASTDRPQSKSRSSAAHSRTIPASVRRAVWARDEGRCAFVGTQGRCTETAFLEFHHVRPYADGGAATVENIELRCRAHNQYEAEQYFGAQCPWMARESAGWSWGRELVPGTSSGNVVNGRAVRALGAPMLRAATESAPRQLVRCRLGGRPPVGSGTATNAPRSAPRDGYRMRTWDTRRGHYRARHPQGAVRHVFPLVLAALCPGPT